MLKFLTTTENANQIRTEDSSYNCGKIDRKNESKSAIRNFTRILQSE